MLVVGVTGSRRWENKARIRRSIAQIIRRFSDESDVAIVHGDCPTGADRIAAEYGEELGFEVIYVTVDPDKDGPWPGAGPKRNRRMLERYRPTVLLAFPDGESRGTWNCIRTAAELGIRVEIPGVGA